MTTSYLSRTAQMRRTKTQGDRFRIGAGFLIVLGAACSIFGLAWDINWHTDVGPDTFFTLPHLVLYSGVAIGGITCLVTVLYSTWTYHQGRSLFPEDTLTSLFWGVFHAPASFVLGGFGTLLFFCYGLFDEVWHSVYGFDVTILSPPHIGLMLSKFVNVAVCLAIFAGVKHKTTQTLGVALTIGLMLVGLVTTLQAVGRFAPELPALLIATFFTFGFVLVASIVRQRGAVLVAALTITLFQVLCWFTVPLITKLYADSLGLFLRDYAKGFSVLAASTPSFVLVAALVPESTLWLGQKQNFSVRHTVLIAGAFSAVTLVFPVQYLQTLSKIMSGNLGFLPSLSSVLVAACLGAGASYLAWMLGSVLRRKGQ